MTSVTPLRREPAKESPALHVRAMDNLAFIRDTMEAAVSFTAVSGWGMVAVGVLAILASAVAAFEDTLPRRLAVWMVAAILAAGVTLWAILLKSRRVKTPPLAGPARKFLLSFSPPMIVGALLTLAFFRSGDFAIIPGMWLLLYGTAVVAGGAFSVKIVPVMGLCFMAAGAVALFTPVVWSQLIMGGTFGVLHIAFGIPIARRHGG